MSMGSAILIVIYYKKRFRRLTASQSRPSRPSKMSKHEVKVLKTVVLMQLGFIVTISKLIFDWWNSVLLSSYLAIPLMNSLSSVARGGGYSPPIGMQSMQNTLFFVLLRPIFGLKVKIAPPPTLALAIRIVAKLDSTRVKTFFLVITWLWATTQSK